MKRVSLKVLVTVFAGLFFGLLSAEGFVAGTLVKTPMGYTPIESLCVGDNVMCYDSHQKLVSRPITYVAKECVAQYLNIFIGGQCIGTSLNQQFYNPRENTWTCALSVKAHDLLLAQYCKACSVDAIEWVNESVDVYCLSVAEHHNFFVSYADICVHNFPPVVIGFAWAFGGGIIEWLGATIGIAGLGGFYYKFGKKSGNHVSFDSVLFNNSMMPDGPEDEDEKKRKRDKARENHHSLTNKEARQLAKNLGYREVRDHPCGNTRNKPVFTNGKEYISSDVDGHNGGIWKVFDCKGNILYTMSEYLTDFFKIYRK